MRIQTHQDGITLLITLLLMGVLLGVSASLLTVTLKQFQLSGITRASEEAFQAASAGMECALNRDFVNSEFDIGDRDPITCFDNVSSEDLEEIPGGDANASSEEKQSFEFSWGSPEICTKISVYKFYDAGSDTPVVILGKNMRDSNGNGVVDGNEACPAGSTCTVIQSRGYNVGCNDIAGNSRVVEREYTQVY